MKLKFTAEQEQMREVAAKFGRNAVQLIESGIAGDVCARKLLAAAGLADPNTQKVDINAELVGNLADAANALDASYSEIRQLRSEIRQLEDELDALRNAPGPSAA